MVWLYEVPVAGKQTHQVFDNGFSLTVTQNERIEGYSEGKYVVEARGAGSSTERFVLSPAEITLKIQEIESYQV